jgi:two-component SAPR family response regulator
MNLFLPSTKLLKKVRVGSKTKRTYDKPKTPLDRVIESGKGDAAKIELHRQLQQHLDPFQLARTIDKKITTIFKMANYRQSPKNVVDTQTTSVVQNHLKPVTRDKLKLAVAAEISRMFGIRAVVGNSHSQVFR